MRRLYRAEGTGRRPADGARRGRRGGLARRRARAARPSRLLPRAVHAGRAQPGRPLPLADRRPSGDARRAHPEPSTADVPAVLGQVGVVAATSANRPGGPDPRVVDEIPEELRAGCGAVLDAGELPGTASTVLDVTGAEPVVVRERARAGGAGARRAACAPEPPVTMPEMAVAQETFERLRTAGLAEVDPDIAELLGAELERQRSQIELIASENFTWPSVLEAVGSTPTNKYAEGYPGQALLRRLRGRRRDRADRDRPGEGALRGRPRQRPAPCGRSDEHGGLHGGAAAGRHDPLARALARRAPDARAQGQLLGPALHDRPLRRQPRDEHGRLRRRAPAREGAPAEADRLRRLRLPAHRRGRPVPRDRRRGRGAAPLRHGALRRARRGRNPPEPGSALRLRHLDDAQDAGRAARRFHPLQGGARAGRRPGGLPRHAGRPARAHDRREGDLLQDRRHRGVP